MIFERVLRVHVAGQYQNTDRKKNKPNENNFKTKPTKPKILFCFAVPSSPPDNVQTGMLNLTAGWVRWLPPPPQHHNGLLLGYKIQVREFFYCGFVLFFLHFGARLVCLEFSQRSWHSKKKRTNSFRQQI